MKVMSKTYLSAILVVEGVIGANANTSGAFASRHTCSHQWPSARQGSPLLMKELLNVLHGALTRIMDVYVVAIPSAPKCRDPLQEFLQNDLVWKGSQKPPGALQWNS